MKETAHNAVIISSAVITFLKLIYVRALIKNRIINSFISDRNLRHNSQNLKFLITIHLQLQM